MPFGRHTPKPPARPPRDEPLMRLGGLLPNRDGTSLGGNVSLGEPRRGSDEPLGVELIDLIQRAMEQQRPLRFIVFEDSGKFPNQPPYTIHATMGRSNGESAQPRAPAQEVVEDLLEEETLPEIPPPPMPTTPTRPIRRTAPRR